MINKEQEIYNLLNTYKVAPGKNGIKSNCFNNVYRNIVQGKKLNTLLGTNLMDKINQINHQDLLTKYQDENPYFLGELSLLLQNPHRYLLGWWNKDIKLLSKMIGVIYEC